MVIGLQLLPVFVLLYGFTHLQVSDPMKDSMSVQVSM